MSILTSECMYILQLGRKDGLLDVHSVMAYMGAECGIEFSTLSDDLPEEGEIVGDLIRWANRRNDIVISPKVLAAYLSERYTVPFKVPRDTKDHRINPALLQYGRCLTEEARDGLLDPVIGRDDEIDACIGTLCRLTKCNPVLVGPSGIGKTAIAYGVVQRIASGNCPPQLADKEVYEIDITRILSGTMYRGMFEERLSTILTIASRMKHILLMNEIHMVVGAGDHGGNDAAGIIKPYLVDGTLSMIGTTTHDDWRRYIEKDAALARRMYRVNVSEPTGEVTKEIIIGLKGRYEDHHNVTIPDGIVDTIVSVAGRYVHSRNDPDKSLDIIDEACVASRKRTAVVAEPTCTTDVDSLISSGLIPLAAAASEGQVVQYVHSTVNTDDVLGVVSRMTGRPVMSSDRDMVLGMEVALKAHVVNQDTQIDTLTRIIRTSYVFRNPSKPMGAILLLGSPGTGKTYLAKLVADHMFTSGGTPRILRLDMGEYSESHSVSSLVGSPPGYVGYDTGGVLTNYVWDNPYSLILLDEIEKAHPSVYNILLGIMDAARLADRNGRISNFSNTLLVFTSNIGSKHIEDQGKLQVGFARREVDSDKEIMEDLRRKFNPEFIDRLTEVIRFNTLRKEDMYRIVDLELRKLTNDSDICISISRGAKDILLDDWTKGKGARDVARHVGTMILDPVSQLVLDGTLTEDGTVQAYVRDGTIRFRRS